ncbi:hypothetical protein IKQ26_10300 [bacterium]|nr:hypothetical protein [bacterium]
MRIQFIQDMIDRFRRKHRIFKVQGEGNILEISDSVNTENFNITIGGDNNRVIIEDGVTIRGSLTIGVKAKNRCNGATVQIGKNTHIGSVDILVLEPDTKVEIGENCMFATNIRIQASDTHSVYNIENNELTNWAKGVFIGNHVWVADDVKIGKSVYISDNSIVSWGSVVYGKFKEPNVVIGGNPASVYKRGVNWDTLSPYSYKIKQGK